MDERDLMFLVCSIVVPINYYISAHQRLNIPPCLIYIAEIFPVSGYIQVSNQSVLARALKFQAPRGIPPMHHGRTDSCVGMAYPARRARK